MAAASDAVLHNLVRESGTAQLMGDPMGEEVLSHEPDSEPSCTEPEPQKISVSEPLFYVMKEGMF